MMFKTYKELADTLEEGVVYSVSANIVKNNTFYDFYVIRMGNQLHIVTYGISGNYSEPIYDNYMCEFIYYYRMMNRSNPLHFSPDTSMTKGYLSEVYVITV